MTRMKKSSNSVFDLINIFCLEYSMVTIDKSKMMGKDTLWNYNSSTAICIEGRWQKWLAKIVLGKRVFPMSKFAWEVEYK